MRDATATTLMMERGLTAFRMVVAMPAVERMPSLMGSVMVRSDARILVQMSVYGELRGFEKLRTTSSVALEKPLGPEQNVRSPDGDRDLHGDCTACV